MQNPRSRVEDRTVTVFNQLSRVVHLSHPEICPNDPSHPTYTTARDTILSNTMT